MGKWESGRYNSGFKNFVGLVLLHNVQFSRLLLENSVQERCYVPFTNFSVLSPLSPLLIFLFLFLSRHSTFTYIFFQRLCCDHIYTNFRLPKDSKNRQFIWYLFCFGVGRYHQSVACANHSIAFDGQGRPPTLDLTVHTHFQPVVSCSGQGLLGTGVDVLNLFSTFFLPFTQLKAHRSLPSFIDCD